VSIIHTKTATMIYKMIYHLCKWFLQHCYSSTKFCGFSCLPGKNANDAHGCIYIRTCGKTHEILQSALTVFFYLMRYNLKNCVHCLKP